VVLWLKRLSRPGFDSLVWIRPIDFKSWYSRLPWRLAFKGIVWKTSREIRLLRLARHFMGLPLPLGGYTSSNRWQLGSNTKRLPSCLLIEVPWQVNEQVPRSQWDAVSHWDKTEEDNCLEKCFLTINGTVQKVSIQLHT